MNRKYARIVGRVSGTSRKFTEENVKNAVHIIEALPPNAFRIGNAARNRSPHSGSIENARIAASEEFPIAIVHSLRSTPYSGGL